VEDAPGPPREDPTRPPPHPVLLGLLTVEHDSRREAHAGNARKARRPLRAQRKIRCRGASTASSLRRHAGAGRLTGNIQARLSRAPRPAEQHHTKEDSNSRCALPDVAAGDGCAGRIRAVNPRSLDNSSRGRSRQAPAAAFGMMNRNQSFNNPALDRSASTEG
jgi:hypothetical protein